MLSELQEVIEEKLQGKELEKYVGSKKVFWDRYEVGHV